MVSVYPAVLIAYLLAHFGFIKEIITSDPTIKISDEVHKAPEKVRTYIKKSHFTVWPILLYSSLISILFFTKNTLQHIINHPEKL